MIKSRGDNSQVESPKGVMEEQPVAVSVGQKVKRKTEIKRMKGKKTIHN